MPTTGEKTQDASRALFVAKIADERMACTQNMIACGSELIGKCEDENTRAQLVALVDELRRLL